MSSHLRLAAPEQHVSNDAKYALVAFVAAIVVLWLDKGWDRYQAKQQNQRVGWAELYRIASEARRCIELLMGLPHPITGENRYFPSNKIFDITGNLYDRLDEAMSDLYLLSALHTKGQLAAMIRTTNRDVGEWLRVSGIARSRRRVPEDKLREEQTKLDILIAQLGRVEDEMRRHLK